MTHKAENSTEAILEMDKNVDSCIIDHTMNGENAESSWAALKDFANQGHSVAKTYVDKVRDKLRQQFELV